MKLTIVISLYILGMFIYAFWRFTDRERWEETNRYIKKDPILSRINSRSVLMLLFFGSIIVSLLWPLLVIMYPFKKKKKADKS